MGNNYYLVRHGKTTSNENGLFMGTLDIPLSSTGLIQAMTLRESIKGMGIDYAFTSPLSRAYQTAVIVLGLAVPISNPDGSFTLSYVTNDAINHRSPLVVEPKLAERSFGDLQGEVKEGYSSRFPKYVGRDVTKSFSDKADGGESFLDLEFRLNEFFEKLGTEHEGKNIIVFSHNGPIRVMRKYFEGLSEEATLQLNNPHCELIHYHK